jgi:dihydrolipoamide dehydrogenase
MFDYDLAVIGGGSGGFAAARTAANYGLRTVVIEGGEEVGGLCILRGCMPTKALLWAAERVHMMKSPNPWGIRAEDVSVNFQKVMARKDELIGSFANYRHKQLSSGKFEFIRAFARFTDEHTVELDSGKKVSAKNFVIATGSKIATSPLPSLDEVGYLTSDSALKLSRLPKSIIVLGGGAVGVEFAQFFARFGVTVTLVQRSPHILHDFDQDAASTLEMVLRREGMVVHTGTQLLEARKVGDSKEIVFSKDGQVLRASAEEIFFALGRNPNTEGLGLAKLGIEKANRCIVCNEEMQSCVPNIYAAGDCTGLHEIVHIAVQQGEVAGHNIAKPNEKRRMDYRLFTIVIFSDPQIANVGLTEKEAKVRGVDYLAASYPFGDHGKSLIMDATDGFVKLLANPTTGEIIGGCCVGLHAGELIHEIVAAMAKRMTVHELALIPHYHPTLAEIWTYPAEELAERIRIK